MSDHYEDFKKIFDALTQLTQVVDNILERVEKLEAKWLTEHIK